MTQASLRAAIGIVPQDTVLFNDTIDYNIAYGRPGASARRGRGGGARGAHPRLHRVAAARATRRMVGERGLKLSGGEKQRVAIARALLKNPRDPDLRRGDLGARLAPTSRRSRPSCERIARDRTTLVIAHRLSTVVDADQILVLDARPHRRARHARRAARARRPLRRDVAAAAEQRARRQRGLTAAAGTRLRRIASGKTLAFRANTRGRGQRSCLEFRSCRDEAPPSSFQPITGVHMKKSFLVGAAVARCGARPLTGAQAHAEDTLKKIKDSGTDHDGRARFVRRAVLHAGRRQVRRLPRRDLPAHHRRPPEAARHAKLEIKYQPVTSQNRIPLVQNGTVDLECGSTTNNATRQKDVAFALTTYVEEVRIAVKANSGINVDRRAQRQDRRHHHRHDLGADCCASTSAPTASTSRKSSARTTPTASCCSNRAAPTPS